MDSRLSLCSWSMDNIRYVQLMFYFVLRYTDSNYPFGIFKMFLSSLTHLPTHKIKHQLDIPDVIHASRAKENEWDWMRSLFDFLLQAHCNNSPWVIMSLHSEYSLSWFRTNQFLLLLINTALTVLVEASTTIFIAFVLMRLWLDLHTIYCPQVLNGNSSKPCMLANN
jgi:hypothetical protein